MTVDEIISYETNYQLQRYLEINDVIAGQLNIPASIITKVNSQESLKGSEVEKVCNVIGLTMDAIAYGPINEPIFKEFWSRCNRISLDKTHWISRLHNCLLQNWTKKHLTSKELERFWKWNHFMGTKESAYVWKRISMMQEIEKCSTKGTAMGTAHNGRPFKQINSALGFASHTNTEKQKRALKIIERSKKKK